MSRRNQQIPEKLAVGSIRVTSRLDVRSLAQDKPGNVLQAHLQALK